MADEKLQLDITAKDDASKVIDSVQKKVDKLESEEVEITVDAKVDQVFRAMQDIVDETKKAESAAGALAAALGPELAAKADVNSIVADLRKVGLEFDDIEAKAGELGARLRDLDGPDGKGLTQLSEGTRRAKGDTDDLSDSARGAKSALANMIGNSAQDVGDLGGIAGSAGVAIGQMAEYASDAALAGEGLGSALKSMALVAGPIGGLTLAVAAIGVVMDTYKQAAEKAAAIKAFNEENAKAYNEFARDNLDITEAYIKKARENQSIDIVPNIEAQSKALDELGLIVEGQVTNFKLATNETYNLNDALDAAGLTVEDFYRAVADTSSLAKYTATVKASNATEEEKVGLLAGVNWQMEQNAKNAEAAAQKTRIYADDTNALATETERLTAQARLYTKEAERQEKQQRALTAEGDRYTAMAQQYASDTAAMTKKVKEYSDTVSQTDFGRAALDGALSGMTKFTDEHFALVNLMAASEEAFDGLSESVKENGKNFDVSTEKGRANQAALQDVAKVLDTQLAAAYADAGGDMDTFKSKAGVIAEQTLTRLQKELGLSDKQTAALAATLGLLPEDIETRYKLSGDEEAKIKVGLLQGAIDNLPDDVQTTVTQQILAGDYQGVLNTVQTYYNNHPVVVPLTYADKVKGGKPYATGGVTGNEPFQVVGEQGPEVVKLPFGSTVYPTSRTRQLLNDMGGGGGNTYVTNNYYQRVAPGTNAGVALATVERQFYKRGGNR